MTIFLFILTNNIIPIFLIISIGYLVGKKFDLQVNTLSKINFYIYVPIFAFSNLYTTEISSVLVMAVVFVVIILFINSGVGYITGKLVKGEHGIENAFQNTIMFYNTGNIGVPLITLIFSSAPFIINGDTPYLNLALSVQIMVLIIQNITTNSIGFFNAAKANMHWRDSVRKILKMPTIYAIPLAFLCKLIPYDLTKLSIWAAIDYIKVGLISVALVTLGVLLTKTKFNLKDIRIYLSVFSRLVLSPIIAVFLIKLFGFDGVVAQVLMISSGLPTAENVALIAVEYKNCPDFVSQVVLSSTVLSSITLTFTIYMANVLFPIV